MEVEQRQQRDELKGDSSDRGQASLWGLAGSEGWDGGSYSREGDTTASRHGQERGGVFSCTQTVAVPSSLASLPHPCS